MVECQKWVAVVVYPRFHASPRNVQQRRTPAVNLPRQTPGVEWQKWVAVVGYRRFHTSPGNFQQSRTAAVDLDLQTPCQRQR